MSENFIDKIFSFIVAMVLVLVLLAAYKEYYRINCLELNLGKETCDKIFESKK